MAVRLLVITLVVLSLTSIETCPFHGTRGHHHQRHGSSDHDDFLGARRQVHGGEDVSDLENPSRSVNFSPWMDDDELNDLSDSQDFAAGLEASRMREVTEGRNDLWMDSDDGESRHYRRFPVRFSGYFNVRPSVVGVTTTVATITLFSFTIMNN